MAEQPLSRLSVTAQQADAVAALARLYMSTQVVMGGQRVMTPPTHSDYAEKPCTCRVTGPDYEQTRFDKACPYHGENGTMVARLPIAPLTPMPPMRRNVKGRVVDGDLL
jgi:hypothetical protein